MRRRRLANGVGIEAAGWRFTGEWLGRKPASRASRQRAALALEPLEARWLMAVAPLEPLDPDDVIKQRGTDPSAYSAPLGFDDTLVELEDLHLGFDADTSAYLKDSADGSLGDATPTGVSYMLYQAWGGTWVDAEKTPSDTEDDLHCWAAAASNVLAWTGWGLVGGMTNTDQMFQYFQDHWTDQGGLMQFGWDWWFDGTNDSQGWGNWAQVDVPGGGFYLSEDFDSYFRSQENESMAMAAIDDYLHDGYGTTIGIYGPGGHAITVWGYNYNPSNPSQYYGIWVTDSDDTKYMENAPDRLRYYEVSYISGKWYLQDYYGSDAWYIGLVQGLAQKEPSEPAPANEIRGTVFNDRNHDGDKDTNEAGLGGKTVYLDTNQNGAWDTQTDTFASTDVGKDILDLTTVTSTLDVSGLAGTITDLNVTLDISHTYDGDIEVYLVGPDGTRVQLFAEVGGSGNNFTNTTLDDQAATSITAGTAPFAGTFRPSGSLADFNGKLANGQWTLEITDNWYYDEGTLNAWSLEITTGEVATTTLSTGAYAFTGLEDGAYQVRVVAPEGWSVVTPGAGYYNVSVAGDTVARNKNFGLSDIQWTSLGTVDCLRLADVPLEAGTTWYAGQAAHSGYLTISAALEVPEDVAVTLYDENFNVLATRTGGLPLSAIVTAGKTYFLQVTAAAPQTVAALNLTNLVSRSGSVITVYDTAGNDDFVFSVDTRFRVSINGEAYSFSRSSGARIYFLGGAGVNTATLTGSTANETFTLRPNLAAISSGSYALRATNVASVVARGGGGIDQAVLYDSAGDDAFLGGLEFSQLSGATYSNRVQDMDKVYTYATAGGNDVAELRGSTGADTFRGYSGYSEFTTAGVYNRVTRFDEVRAFGEGGVDRAFLYDSTGNDTFVAEPTVSYMTNGAFHNQVESFRYVYAYSTAGGADVARLYDSAGDDAFVATPTTRYLTGAGFYNRAQGFRYVYGYSTAGGSDTATLYDSTGDDRFEGYADHSIMSGSGYYNQVDGFRSVVANARSNRRDVAVLYDSAGDDTFLARPGVATLSGDSFSNQAKGFRYVYGYSTAGGHDAALLHGSSGDDRFYGYETYAQFYTSSSYFRVSNFADVTAFGYRGTDRAYLYDSAGDDTFVARPTVTYLAGDAFHNQVENFRYVYAYSTAGGNDVAQLYDSAGSDRFAAAVRLAYLSGSSFYNRAQGFGQNYGYSTAGGADQAYLYDSAGDDTFVAEPTVSYITDGAFRNQAEGFRYVYAYSRLGGSDQAYLYDSAGDDHLAAAANAAILNYAASRVSAIDFSWVRATASEGGNDTKTIGVIDFVLETLGAWNDV